MSESKWREALAEALASQQFANRVLHWRQAGAIADALLASPVLAQMKREWQAQVLREAADELADGPILRRWIDDSELVDLATVRAVLGREGER